MAITLQRLLKDADERVKQAAAEALNESSEKLIAQMKHNLDAQGIRNRTGNLRSSFKIKKATTKNLKAMIMSEVYGKPPRRPGLYNPKMKGRYKNGTPYGRLIEFSPRINKPFFYKAWYESRKNTKDYIMEKIGDAWSG